MSRSKQTTCLHNTYNIGNNKYRLITAYLLLQVNCNNIMHARWDFDSTNARTRRVRVSALVKNQNWSESALFRHNSRTQSKYAVVNLIHIRHKHTFCLFYVKNKTFIKFKKSWNNTCQNKIIRVANGLTLSARESTLCDAHAHVSIAWSVRSAIVPR